MTNIAIIPARSGSKGLPDKNIRVLNNKPLLAYTVEAALESNIFEEVFVSTDSLEYAKIAKEAGASVPFLRSEELATDTASSWDAVRETLGNYKKIGKVFDTCMLLQPTSPLRECHDICNAYNLYLTTKANTVVSVCEVDHPIQWCFPLESDCLITELATSPYSNMRRQDLQKHYRENGAIYIVNANDIMNRGYDIYKEKCYAYIMDKRKSIDIDDEYDFEMVKFLIKKCQ